MEIEKIVNEKFLEIVQSGKIEKMIEEKLLSSIKSIVNDCLQSYGNFGTEIKKKIQESLQIGNMKLDFPSYNQLVCNWIMEIVDNQIIHTGKEQMQENIKKFFIPLNKSEYKLSEIVQAFKDSICVPSHNRIALFIDNSDYDGYISLFLDEDPEKSKHSCEYYIRINKDGIWAAELEDANILKSKALMLHRFEAFIFKLYAAKVKIIDDSKDDSISKYFSDNDSEYDEE